MSMIGPKYFAKHPKWNPKIFQIQTPIKFPHKKPNMNDNQNLWRHAKDNTESTPSSDYLI